MKAKISIARVSSNREENTNMIEIEFKSTDHLRLATISIDPKDFILALTGMAGMPCEITFPTYNKGSTAHCISTISIEEMQARLDKIPTRPSLAELGYTHEEVMEMFGFERRDQEEDS